MSIAYGGPYPTLPGTIEIQGGDGDDRMSGGTGSGGSDFSEGYLLDGGHGNDWLNGSRLWSGTMLGGPGADELIFHAESPT